MDLLEALQRIDDSHFVVVEKGRVTLGKKRVGVDGSKSAGDLLTMSEGDLLARLFAMQQDLEETNMHFDFANMTEQQRGEYVRDHSLFCMDELHEMFHEIPFFKQWKRYSKDPADNAMKWQKARMEFVDALHFFLSVAIALGFTPAELFNMYAEKNAENKRRQQDQTEYKPSADEA